MLALACVCLRLRAFAGACLFLRALVCVFAFFVACACCCACFCLRGLAFACVRLRFALTKSDRESYQKNMKNRPRSAPDRSKSALDFIPGRSWRPPGRGSRIGDPIYSFGLRLAPPFGVHFCCFFIKFPSCFSDGVLEHFLMDFV